MTDEQMGRILRDELLKANGSPGSTGTALSDREAAAFGRRAKELLRGPEVEAVLVAASDWGSQFYGGDCPSALADTLWRAVRRLREKEDPKPKWRVVDGFIEGPNNLCLFPQVRGASAPAEMQAERVVALLNQAEAVKSGNNPQP